MLHHTPLLFLESLGTGEVMLIVFVIIVFFGGKKVPEMARVLGKGMREFKAAANNIQDEIQKSVTEIERNVNVHAAELTENLNVDKILKDEPHPMLVEDPASPQVSQPITANPKPVAQTGPLLVRAEEPEPKKEVPPAP